MVLVSPGVEVTIIDQAQYLPAPSNSVPLVVFATAQNKQNPNGTGVAPGTTAANANKLYLVTSQRDLTTLYGMPFFYSDTTGTPIQGYELNEYGLLAAYSALGATNRLYALRVDINLGSLVGSTGRPSGEPNDGTYWQNTTSSTWGIFEFNSTTGLFSAKTPIVLSDSSLLSGGLPLGYLGTVGSYAVYAPGATSYPSASTSAQYFYKSPSNIWVQVGTDGWMNSWPTIQGSVANASLTPGDTLTLDIGDGSVATITVQGSPNNVLSILANDVNDLGWPYLTAGVVNNKLVIYSAQTNTNTDANRYVTISGTGTLLEDVGITAGTYYQPALTYGNAAQQPLWQASQTYPRPSGSVWIKTGTAGGGLVPAVSVWNRMTKVWTPKNVSLFNSDWAVTSAIDSTGGQAIPANTIYGQFTSPVTDSNTGTALSSFTNGPVYLWKRLAEGPTVITGSVTNPTFSDGPYTAYVQVSLPGSSALSAVYTMTLADNATATQFITAWQAAAIPFTTATVTTSGAIQLTHTEGGVIVLNDINTSGGDVGKSAGLFSTAGFIPGTTTGVKYGPYVSTEFTVTGNGISPSVGTSLSLTVTNPSQVFNITGIDSGGSGFAVGDEVRFSGATLGGTTPANDLVVKVTSVTGGVVDGVTFVSGSGSASGYSTQLSNWTSFTYVTNEGAPVYAPSEGTNWFYSVVDQVDIMINYNGAWLGYRNIGYDYNGFPSTSIVNATDPNGPIISASEPTTQSDGTALVYGDLWINSSDLENYPVIFRWQYKNNKDQWVKLDNTNQEDPYGVLFADARWAPNGTVNPANDPIPTIVSLLTSDYLDLDAPEANTYPTGMLLFNLRRSGNNVKKYRVNYFNSARFPDETLPNQKDAWVTASGLQSNGTPYMGRKAQRSMVVQAMRVALDTNTDIRTEDNYFNLIATPNYPELQPNMVVLNADRGETAFIVGDTPMRLPEDATAIQAWATNAAGATSTGEDGLVTRNSYMGLFYPSGIAAEPVNGTLVAVPASHMMLRTLLRNDQIAYPWFAPAGTRRGLIQNATNIGYVNSRTNEFVTTRTRIGIRDILYTNYINPMVFFTGVGLLNYGNKTSFESLSALDRINVARLVAFLRRQLTIAARPFVFEPNDALTRSQISAVVDTLMVDLVTKRGIYDYIVQCDDQNNTPARIDRNELWIDVAIEPVKAAEFIYIPVRIFGTGRIGS